MSCPSDIDTLILISTHGSGNLHNSALEERLHTTVNNIASENPSSVLGVGFDGDGAYGEVWPTASTLSVNLVYSIKRTTEYTCHLVQSQIANYAGSPTDYSKKVPIYNISANFEDPDEQNYIPFHTLAYYTYKTTRENTPPKGYFNETVDVDIGADSNNMYGGTYTQIIYDEDMHKLAGSTDAWAKSTLFPNVKQVHLIVIWDEGLAYSQDKSFYDLSNISRQTIAAAESGLFKVNGLPIKTHLIWHSPQ